ncbi:MAG: B12-binding domain-containing radical SAM protein [Candidatus Micrarchaeota archaeon]|nr:B12-binding domain-containing radical SAM protein [Candidatus Micrarchaeota archaeon]
MAKYVLLSDDTLIYDYRNFPLLDFLPCAPVYSMPDRIYTFLKGRVSPPVDNGRLMYAPYGLRKVEAALLGRNSAADVVVAHPDYMENFIKEDTEVIGINTMDPFGLGPTTMSFYALFESYRKGHEVMAFVRQDWENLIFKVNRLRENRKAKLLVGGPGVWEYMLMPEEIERHRIDYLFQGETDDVVPELFGQIASNNIDSNMFAHSYVTYDDSFRRTVKEDPRFLSRGKGLKTFPSLDTIPDIVNPSTKGLTESMRGCGIGCDFCEVTLRELRYYPIEKMVKEIKVNVEKGGSSLAWLHSDEIFAYKHLPRYVPNEDALVEVFTAIMAIKGVERSNPTHGRISIPAAYPGLIEKLSKIMRAGPNNYIGIQVGLETGSDKLALKHMPAKTLPLSIGKDGTWQEIVWNGVHNLNKYYWRPAFTVQVGQTDETDEDNWDTVALINRLSNSVSDGRPFEFTVNPLLNVPLGRIKSKNIDATLSQSMLAVYVSSYRHLAKMAIRDAWKDSSGNPIVRAGTAGIIGSGGYMMYKAVERIAAKNGVDVEKARTYGIGNKKDITAWNIAVKA